jgi:tetratricopeptide (TPR) repeat protein
MKIIKYNFEQWVVLIICLILFPSYLFSQHNTHLKIILESDLSKEEKIYKTDLLFIELEEEQYDSLSYLYHEYASWLDNINESKKAISFEQKALEILKLKSLTDSAFLQKCTISLGLYYRHNEQFVKSIDVFNDALLLNYNNDHVVDLYNYLGYSYFYIKDYHNAIKYWDLTVVIVESTDIKYNAYLRNGILNLSFAYERLATVVGYKMGLTYAYAADSIAGIITTTPYVNYLIKKQPTFCLLYR